MDLNLVILTGNLGKAPEIQESETGTVWARCSIAVNRGYRDDNDEWQQTTDWFQVKAFGKRAEALRKLRKGAGVTVEAKLSPNEYEKDGVKIYTNEIIARNIKFY